MLAGLLLFWWVILFETVTDGMAGVLRTVTATAAGFWPAKHDLSWWRFIPPGPAILMSEAHPYDIGYEAAMAMAKRRSLPEIFTALRLFLPTAASEQEWGMADAMADEIQRRTS